MQDNRLTFRGLLFGLVAALLSITGCRKEENKIPVQIDKLPVNTIFTDTVTVLTSTVCRNQGISSYNISDTLGNPILFCGAYADSDLGKISAEGYAQLQLLTENEDLSGATVDSAVLHLNYQYAYGDTNQLQTLYVHQLTAPIGDSYYTNSEPLPYINPPIGSITFKAKPKTHNTLHIPVSNSFASHMISAPKNNEAFKGYFHGLAFVPENNYSGAIIRVNTTSPNTFLRIYYRTNGQPKEYNLVMTSSTKRCYRISNDRSASPIAPIVQPYADELSSTQTSNKFFVQSATGIQTKITFPYLKNFLSKGNIQIHKAELIFHLADNAHTGLPPNNRFFMYELNPDNTTRRYGDGSEAILQKSNFPINGTSSPLLISRNNTSHHAELKSYLQAILYGNKPDYGIALAPYYNSSLINKSVFNSYHATSNPMRLKLYYTIAK